jgi:hypothetical protein
MRARTAGTRACHGLTGLLPFELNLMAARVFSRLTKDLLAVLKKPCRSVSATFSRMKPEQRQSNTPW